MQRDMSYDLDGVFATRNQGQLINQQKVQNKVLRMPGLVEMGRPKSGPPGFLSGLGESLGMSPTHIVTSIVAIGALCLVLRQGRR